MKIKALWCLGYLAVIGFFGWKAVQQTLLLIRMNLPLSEWGTQWARWTVIGVSMVTCTVFVVLLVRQIGRMITDIRINRENH
jgi:TRAP-type C4-dicarboxylate transport system permease small subunit